jgi:thiol-disulfide isomerase/thioredoxin
LLKPLDLVRYRSGTTPADLRGTTVDARPASLSALRGKVVLVNFWASWCLDCRLEMPVLERLHRELGPQDLAVDGVNVRESGETISRYASELGLSFPLVLDPHGAIAAQYGMIGLPATFLVGRDGRAVVFAIGAREWDGASARALLGTLLAEPAPRTPE